MTDWTPTTYPSTSWSDESKPTTDHYEFVVDNGNEIVRDSSNEIILEKQ